MLASSGRCAGKVFLAYGVHMPVVALERKYVIGALLHDLPGNGLLAAHGINGDDAA